MCPHVLARVGALHVRRRPAQQGTPVGAVVRVQRALCAVLSAVGALWSCSAPYHWGGFPVRLSAPERVLSWWSCVTQPVERRRSGRPDQRPTPHARTPPRAPAGPWSPDQPPARGCQRRARESPEIG